MYTIWIVMPGLTRVSTAYITHIKVVDGRIKSGHDGMTAALLVN